MRNQRGMSPSVEAAIIIPGILLLLGLLVVVARIVVVTHSVESAAFAGARAASMERSQATASRVGKESVVQDLGTRNITCLEQRVSVDTSQTSVEEGAPAVVTVKVTCRISLADVAIPGMGGSHTITVTASSPIDTYRER